jgi:hypothetical protein
MESPEDEQNARSKDMSQIARLTSNNYSNGHFELHWLNGDKIMQLRVPDKQPATLYEVQKLFQSLKKLGLLVRHRTLSYATAPFEMMFTPPRCGALGSKLRWAASGIEGRGSRS